MAEYKGLKAILKRFCDLIEPVGTVKMSASTITPTWHLHAVGQLVNIADYPELYEALGGASSPWNTGTIPSGQFRIPDMRECTPVGVGKNTTLIFDNTELDPATGTQGTQDHDVYTIGEFKDDQFQGHNHLAHNFGTANGNAWTESPHEIDDYGWQDTGNITSKTGYGIARYGTTTHGKQVGLNYIIKY